MRILQILRNSLKGLLTNKLRTLLTMLGVIIGVFSVIMLTSIGEGVKKQVTNQVESLGANLIYVIPGNISLNPGKRQSKLGIGNQVQFGQGQSTLTYQDVLALKPMDSLLVTGFTTGVDQLNKMNIAVTTTGVDEDYLKIRSLDLRYGRSFTKSERVNQTPVAVIGYETNKELFNGKNSIGKNFSLNGKAYQVVGILAYKKPDDFGPGSDDINIRIHLPITEILSRTHQKNIQEIIIKARSAEEVTSTVNQVRRILKSRHQTEDFSIFKQQDMLNAINNIIGILTTALGGIAAISLVVGGIGIMNIMLVSVSERTREIGIRKAVGAKYRDILVQFLIESIVLSLLGGVLGLLAGIGGSRLLPHLIPSVHTAISPLAVIISLLFSVLVGIFFGVYPASKAARLDPIESLRSE